MSKEIQKRTELEEANRPFVLAHPDLRCGNIIVDESFHILGILDWEFTSTIPQQLFMPPPWITGHDPDTLLMLTGIPRGQVWLEFSNVLEELHETSDGWTQLWQDWGFMHEDGNQNKDRVLELSPILQILQHPSSLMDVYYSSIFQRLFGSEICRDKVVNGFFEDTRNQALAEQVDIQIKKSERYTEYLEANDPLIPDERSQQIQEVLAKAKAMLEAGQKRRSKES